MPTSAPSSVQRVADAHEVAGAVVDDGDADGRGHASVPPMRGRLPFVEATPGAPRIGRHGHAQGAGQGLEGGLREVVVVAAGGVEVQRRPGGLGEGGQGVLDELGRERADPLAPEGQVEDGVGPTREVERALRRATRPWARGRRRSG